MNANEALAGVWQLGRLPPQALRHAMLSGADPVLPSSFAVGTVAQVPIAAAALAARELGHARGQTRQDVHIDMLHAALECVGWFSVDGRVPEIWDKFSGLYRCADGWVRVHANFAHHRDGALRLLGLPPETAQRADAERALQAWRALDFEQAAADRGLVVAALRRFDEWDEHPQGQVIAAQPLMTFERIGDAPPSSLPRPQANKRQLACSGFAGADRAMDAQPGACAGRLRCSVPGSPALSGNNPIGIWRTGGCAPQRAVVVDARPMDAPLSPAWHRSARVAVIADRAGIVRGNALPEGLLLAAMYTSTLRPIPDIQVRSTGSFLCSIPL